MDHLFLLLCLFLQLFDGVYTDPTLETTSISAMEGESVILHTGVRVVLDHILWTFGSKHTIIANIYSSNNVNSNNVNSEIFKGRLHVDFKTGSLTIKNVRTTDSGLYHLNIIFPSMTERVKSEIFNVTVYASLPTPLIRDSKNCSSSSERLSVSRCSLLCSVVNVSHASLSWYKGNRLLSSISVSDLSISLSLPLEVEYQDTNTYSCVVNNPIRHHTTHLDYMDLCKPCPGSTPPFYLLALIPVVLAVGIVFYCIYRKHKQEKAVVVDHTESPHVDPEVC